MAFFAASFAWFLLRWFSFILMACAICIHDLYFRCFFPGSFVACLSLAPFNFEPLRSWCGVTTLEDEIFVTRTSNWNREIRQTTNYFNTLEKFFIFCIGNISDILGNDFRLVWIWCMYSYIVCNICRDLFRCIGQLSPCRAQHVYMKDGICTENGLSLRVK